ncbi:HAD family hydrolase [Desulfobotulus sp. H1]|uniref:phosphoglycolate phosphatase n=1 Tax=Desulfobotulus pelophilus TaxID=2823377 RepID=A0ABT3N725_9BACT|nr:HAD family hydrolase [Desulfobotulus pelophilus]MCW7753251.1 HAD family hydrolase [Desulfobotulus pelophilus]
MIQFRNIQAVAFDCDGVMINSTEANRTYYNTQLQAFGLDPMTDADFHHVHMHTASEAIRHLFEGRVPLDQVKENLQHFHYPDLFPLMIEEPHLRKLLKNLRPHYRTAVATNRSNTLRPLLDYFDLTKYFDKLITSMDVVRPKPHPDMLTALVKHFGLSPENLLYIGDSPLDARAASEAGCHFIGYGAEDLGAELHIQTLDRLHDFLSP